MKKVLILQARMGSTRLPGKVLKEVMGRPLLDYLIERLKRSSLIDTLVVATTRNPKDDSIASFCLERGLSFFRGSEEDVLERFLQAAEKFQGDLIIRVTSDCPLADPLLIDKIISAHLEERPRPDYTSNVIFRTYPRGMDVEVFSIQALRDAERLATAENDREHVTPFFYEHPERFALKNVARRQNDSHLRWTLDTQEDLELITKILEEIYPEKPDFTFEDLLALIQKHPRSLK